MDSYVNGRLLELYIFYEWWIRIYINLGFNTVNELTLEQIASNIRVPKPTLYSSNLRLILKICQALIKILWKHSLRMFQLFWLHIKEMKSVPVCSSYNLMRIINLLNYVSGWHFEIQQILYENFALNLINFVRLINFNKFCPL